MSEESGGESAAEVSEVSESVESTPVESTDVSVESSESVDVSTEPASDDDIADIIEESGEEVTEEKIEAIRKIMLKVDGQEIEEELPFDLPPEALEYMQKQLQLAKVSQKRMQQTSDMERNIEALAGKLETSPLDFLKEQGFDVDSLMESHLDKLVKEMELSPEEKAQNDMELELNELRERIKTEEESRANAELAASQQAAESELTTQIETALEAHSVLPQDANTVRKMADLMLVADDNNITLSPEQAAKMLEKEAMRDALSLLNSMEGNALEKFLGESNNKKLRSLRAGRAKPATPVSEIKETGNAAEKKEIKKKIKSRDFFKNLGK